jgi:hypothetical protein
MSRARILGLTVVAAALAVAGVLLSPRSEAAPRVEIYRSATCGCCLGWARHLEANGFDVTVHDVERMEAVKARLGVPRGLGACHTAEVEGFVVEGHVPAEDVHRLLEERPDVTGLAVPGMPEGSPGMEGPNPEPYTVWAFRDDGHAAPWAEHGL